MDAKPFSAVINSPLHRFRCRASLLRPFFLAQARAKSRFQFFHSCSTSSPSSRLSPLLCCLRMSIRALPSSSFPVLFRLLIFPFYFFFPAAENGHANNALPCEVGQSVTDVSQNRLLQVVLVSPQIPGNTGCIARSCAASAVGLHLVEPLGFQVDDTKLKRAGLDYWPYVVVKVHGSWADFRDYFRKLAGEKRLLAFTKRGKAIHSDFAYRRGDWLVFGSETSGLPAEALFDCENEPLGGGTIRIPMVETYVRCLNLSVSVGIGLYEASRQLNYEQLHYPSGSSIPTTENSFISEDIFA